MPEDNSIAFLDTKVRAEDNVTVSFGIYRKPTHTDQYLHLEPHYHVKQKVGIIKKTFRHLDQHNHHQRPRQTNKGSTCEGSSQKLQPPRMVSERISDQEEEQDSQAG